MKGVGDATGRQTGRGYRREVIAARSRFALAGCAGRVVSVRQVNHVVRCSFAPARAGASERRVKRLTRIAMCVDQRFL